MLPNVAKMPSGSSVLLKQGWHFRAGSKAPGLLYVCLSPMDPSRCDPARIYGLYWPITARGNEIRQRSNRSTVSWSANWTDGLNMPNLDPANFSDRNYNGGTYSTDSLRWSDGLIEKINLFFMTISIRPDVLGLNKNALATSDDKNTWFNSINFISRCNLCCPLIRPLP